ncbi:MAG: hypothetical protein K6F91_06135, partial [Ruminococcus sp.]|nr:hypothetical protein [Ruminococcus sp.]
GGTENVWQANDVDLSTLNGTAAVQFYYIKDGAEVSVDEVSIKLYGSDNEETADDVDGSDEDDEQDDTADTAGTDDTADTDTDDDDVITNEDDDEDADADADDEEVDADDDTDEYDEDETYEEGESVDHSDVAYDGEITTLDKSAVESKVADAAQQAGANPQTGDSTQGKIRMLIMLISASVLVYSGAAILINRLIAGRKNKG